MGPIATGMAQSWLTVPVVVLSQLFTLLFIGGFARVLRRKGRGHSASDRPSTAQFTSTKGSVREGLSRLAQVMSRSQWLGNNEPSQRGHGFAQ